MTPAPACGDLTPARLAAALAFWQATLRLQDWNIYTRIVRGSEVNQGVIGRCTPTACRNRALILIVDTPDMRMGEWPECPEDWEYVLVHELLHITLDPLGLKADTPQGNAEEQVIDRLAGVLVGLARAPLGIVP